MYYKEELIEEIRSRNDIVDVIGSYITLKKKGNSYWACCPFHNEKSASFSVSRDKQLYHCFGCGASGSVYTFLQQYENYTFPEAVEYLADRCGIELPKQEMSSGEKKEADYKSRLREANKTAASYFYYTLRQPDGAAGMEYFKSRELTEETMHKFGLGYANVYSDDLYRYMKSKGYEDQVLRDAGLIKVSESHGASDVFWNRVMFPIMDMNGKVLGFGGRVLGKGEPKYVNTQDTKIYEKRRHLYGFQFARRSKREGFILCEGYMDVIAMHQAGFDNATASLGTAFTPAQALLLKRYADKVYLAYDSDDAGIKAAQKAIEILGNTGIAARIIDMKPYKDPDEFIKNLGKEAFEERIRNAESSIMFQVRIASLKYDQQDPQSRTEFQKEIASIVMVLEDPLERENYVEAIANRYVMDKKLLKDMINRYGKIHVEWMEQESARQEAMESRMRSRRQEVKEERRQQPQRLLLTWLTGYPEQLFPQLSDKILPEDFTDPICKELAGKVYAQYEKDGKINLPFLINGYADTEKQSEAAAILQTELKNEVDAEEKSRVITEIVRRVKEESVKNQLDHLQDISMLQSIVNVKKEIPNWKITITEKSKKE